LSLFTLHLFCLHGNSVGDCPLVLPDAANLPRNFDPWLVAFDPELVASDLACHYCMGELADYGQLIAKLLIKRIEVVRQSDQGFSPSVCDDIAAVDIQHLG
jgi:hypothetical protein